MTLKFSKSLPGRFDFMTRIRFVYAINTMTRGCVKHRGFVVRTLFGHYHIVGVVVGTTRTEHKAINAHSYVIAFRFYAFPNKHASPFQVVNPARLRTNLVCWKHFNDVNFCGNFFTPNVTGADNQVPHVFSIINCYSLRFYLQ